MTKEELIKELLDLQDCGDAEIAHVLADKALLEYINDDAVTKEFDAIKKWYA